MKPRSLEAFVLGALLGAVVMGMARRDDFGRLSGDMRAAEDSIAANVQTIAQLTVRADSLGSIAHRSDTVRVYIERAAIADVERATDMARLAADSLRATLDSSQAITLTNVELAHDAEMAAVWRIADSRLAWGMGWRSLAVSQDSLIAAQSAQLALYDVVATGLRSALVRERQQVWLSRSAALLGVVTVLVLK